MGMLGNSFWLILLLGKVSFHLTPDVSPLDRFPLIIRTLSSREREFNFYNPIFEIYTEGNE